MPPPSFATQRAQPAPSARATEALLRPAVAAFTDETEHPVRVVGLESAHERLAQLTIEQAAVQKFADAEECKAVQSARIRKAMHELQARASMLNDIRRLNAGCVVFTEPAKDYANLRAELKGLAAEWGYKIVLIGDNSYGTLAKA